MKELPQKSKLADAVETAINSGYCGGFPGRAGSLSSSNYGYRLTGTYHGADQKRDVWTVAGYPEFVYFDDHWKMVRRNAIANAACYLPIEKTWQDRPTISDGEYDEKRTKTAFERDVDILINKHKLFTRLKGFDKRQALGRYGSMLIVAKEIVSNASPQQPLRGAGIDSLVKLVPLFESEASVSPSHISSDISDPNYGNPTAYEFRSWVPGSRSPLQTASEVVDASRIYSWGEGADDGTIFGIPCLEPCFNALLDLEKVSAAGAEGHFKNAKQRVVYNVKDSQVASVLQGPAKEQFDEAQESFTRDFDTGLTTYGMDVQTLQSTIADPNQPFTIALNQVAAARSIPSTILIGQQTGRLASDEDQSHFGQMINGRRDNEITDMMIGLFEHLIKVGIMSPPDNEITITWDDLTEPSAGDKLDLGIKMADINLKDFQAGGNGMIYDKATILKTTGHEPDEVEKSGDGDYAEGGDAGLGAEQI